LFVCLEAKNIFHNSITTSQNERHYVGHLFDCVTAVWSLQNALPCINAGDTVGVSDIAGNTRIYAANIDMGAYEYQGVVVTTSPSQPEV